MTNLEYLALSELIYQDLSGFVSIDPSVTLGDFLEDNLINGYEVDTETGTALEVKPALNGLTSLGDWRVIAYEGSSIGFGAAAFKNDSTGEIVFTFRGSNDALDWAGNLALGVGVQVDALLGQQFPLAADFVFETLNAHGSTSYASQADMFDALDPSSNVSFTGHSLGGGLAQYMTYKTADIDSTDGGAQSVTFNAVGIGLNVSWSEAVPVTGTRLFDPYPTLAPAGLQLVG